jgi:hypothetical protein
MLKPPAADTPRACRPNALQKCGNVTLLRITTFTYPDQCDDLHVKAFSWLWAAAAALI